MRHVRLLVLTLAGVFLTASALSPLLIPAALAQSSPATINFAPLNGSGITGTATLSDQGNGRTRIEVHLTPASGDHPMHIHEGACATANPAPWYALANVQAGASTTDVNLGLADLTRTQKSILVHQSPQQLDTVVACADLVAPRGAAQVAGAQAASDVAVLPPGGEPEVPLRPVVALAFCALGGLGLFYLVSARPPRHGGA